MIENSVHAYVKELIASALCIEEGEIDDAQPLTQYGFSSIDAMDLIVKLEEKFQIKFEPEKMRNLTCQMLVSNIETRMAGR